MGVARKGAVWYLQNWASGGGETVIWETSGDWVWLTESGETPEVEERPGQDFGGDTDDSGAFNPDSASFI